MPSLLPVIGTLLLAVLLADVFLTVFHAGGRGGPVNRRQNEFLWRISRAAGIRGDGSPRHAILAFGGPAIVAVTLVVWLAWLVLGFFLIYLPSIPSFLVSPGELRTPWMEALYFSMYTGATLGLGDLVADAGWLRLVSALQAMAGFALFSISITYLLSVYGELIAARATASGIATRFADGREAVAERIEAHGVEPFARWAEGTTPALLAHIQGQFQYPVINYFHSPDTSRALPVQLQVVLRFDDLVQRAQDGEMARLRDHPSYLALRRAVGQLITETKRHFLPDGFREPGASAEHEPDDQALASLRAYMGYTRAAERDGS